MACPTSPGISAILPGDLPNCDFGRRAYATPNPNPINPLADAKTDGTRSAGSLASCRMQPGLFVGELLNRGIPNAEVSEVGW